MVKDVVELQTLTTGTHTDLDQLRHSYHEARKLWEHRRLTKYNCECKNLPSSDLKGRVDIHVKRLNYVESLKSEPSKLTERERLKEEGDYMVYWRRVHNRVHGGNCPRTILDLLIYQFREQYENRRCGEVFTMLDTSMLTRVCREKKADYLISCICRDRIVLDKWMD